MKTKDNNKNIGALLYVQITIAKPYYKRPEKKQLINTGEHVH